MTTVDSPDFVDTTSIHHGSYVAYNPGAQVIAASGVFTSPLIPITKPGYWMHFASLMAANAANPFILIQVAWIDTLTGVTFISEKWVGPAGTLAGIGTFGRGQVKANQVQLIITNLDAAQSVTVTPIVIETSHSPARDDWRSQMNANWTTTVAHTFDAKGSFLTNALHQQVTSIPATTTQFYQLPLYAGQVMINEVDAGAANLIIGIVPTQQIDTANGTPDLIDFTGAAAGVNRICTLPRQPCQVRVQNTNAAAVTLNIAVIITELAS